MNKKLLAIVIACVINITAHVYGMQPQQNPAWFQNLNFEGLDLNDSESGGSGNDSDDSEMSDLELPEPMQVPQEEGCFLPGSPIGA